MCNSSFIAVSDRQQSQSTNEARSLPAASVLHFSARATYTLSFVIRNLMCNVFKLYGKRYSANAHKVLATGIEYH